MFYGNHQIFLPFVWESINNSKKREFKSIVTRMAYGKNERFFQTIHPNSIIFDSKNIRHFHSTRDALQRNNIFVNGIFEQINFINEHVLYVYFVNQFTIWFLLRVNNSINLHLLFRLNISRYFNIK